jgi:hypothetical protein
MFIEFGDLSIDVSRIIGYKWNYNEEIVQNALGLNVPGKGDEIIGCSLFLDNGIILNVEDGETAQQIKEYYERNVQKAGLHAQSSTEHLH